MAFFRTPTYNTSPTAAKSDIPAGLWIKCKQCQEIIYQSILDENLQVCPHCNYYYTMTAAQRLKMFTDKDSFQEMDADLRSYDALDFAGTKGYVQKLQKNREKTKMEDAVITGMASLDGIRFAIGIMDFRFMGASMGSVVGEKITRLAEAAIQQKKPVVLVIASGGARMQEGALSLMQMAKTSAAFMRLDDAKLPLIDILTNPTTGGVTASFASLGDIILAEPHALIGFAGPRVIKQTTQAELPKDFQSSEFLLKHGFIDRIVERKKLREELSLILNYFN
ncbi:MAG: acetyl-CoA carboxylase, carboxyltransferase subunit beta [Lentisphaeria bacterium]